MLNGPVADCLAVVPAVFVPNFADLLRYVHLCSPLIQRSTAIRMSQVVWGQKGAVGGPSTLLQPPAQSASLYATARRHPGAVSTTPQVLCMAWNHDATCLAVGTTDGFFVYSTESLPRGEVGSSSSSGSGARQTLVEVARRHVSGGVGHIAMHEQSSVLLLAGASPDTEATVLLWNDALNTDGGSLVGGSTDAAAAGPFFQTPEAQCVVARLRMSGGPVAALRMHEHLILVAEPFRVHLYDAKLRHVDSFLSPNHGKRSTSFSSKGDHGLVWDNTAQTIALATYASKEVFRGEDTSIVRAVTLGPSTGSVRCLHYFAVSPSAPGASVRRRANSMSRDSGNDGGGPMGGSSAQADGFVESKLVDPHPHTHRVQCLAISVDGALALSCSVQGTTIKLLDTRRAVVVRQFNRGITTSVVGCMTFSVDGLLAACIAQSGTVHIFGLREGGAGVGGGGGDGNNSSRSSGVSKYEDAGSSSGGASWGHTAVSVVSRGLKSLQSVAPVGSTSLGGLEAFVSSTYAISTFSLSLANADSDGLRLRPPLGTSSAANADGAGQQQQQPQQRSARSEALLMEDEDCLQRMLDVSEHSGFDPLFTALQFRPGFAPMGGGSGPPSSSPADSHHHQHGAVVVHLLMSCGNVTPNGYGLKSKCVQVAVPLSLPSSSSRRHYHASSGAQDAEDRHRLRGSSGGSSLSAPAAPYITTTCLFPKEVL